MQIVGAHRQRAPSARTERSGHWPALAIATALVSALLLAGCASSRLSDAVTDVNQQLAEADNRQLLLNILRRGNGYPLYFTAIKVVRDHRLAAAGANVSATGGGDGQDSFSFNPFLELEFRPQFEVSPQQNQEFYRALLSSVSVATIRYFLQQDYRRELVLFLVIDKVRIRGPDADRLFLNVPQQGQAFLEFQSALENLVDQGLAAEDIPARGEELVAVNYGGSRYSVPSGLEGGLSGEVLSFVSQLLAQAQSVEDLQNSRSVTLIRN